MCYAGVNFNYKFPFLYLLSALVAGILSNAVFPLPTACFYGLAVLAFLTSWLPLARHFTDLLLLSALFCCGQQIATFPSFHPQPSSVYFIRGRCEEEIAQHKYILSVGNEKFYLGRFQPDTLSLIPGDSLYFYSRILPFSSPSNPGEFNYARYLLQKEVRFRLLPVSPIRKHGRSANLFFYFTDLRQHLLTKTSALITDTASRQVINALTLGFKNDLNKDLQQLFISTGTIHLLSVSGLHTGAIYLLLLYIFKYLGIRGRTREWIVLPFLWSYACLTGLSPSVVRAATILTFIAMGKIFYRDYTPLNAVAASAFFTLLFRPFSLYSLSFLMSYSAYTGILVVYPLLYRLPKTLPRYLSKIYACFCLTLAAQLPTLPISAFCFHTVNLNGLLTNLPAVPLATLLLYGSTISLLLPLKLSLYISPLLEFLCRMLLRLLHFFRSISFNIQNLYPTFGIVLFAYAALILLLFYLYQRKLYWLKATCYGCILLTSFLSLHNLRLTSRQEIVVFHIYRQTDILLNYKGYYTHLKHTTSNTQRIKPYLLQNKLHPLPKSTGLSAPSLLWKSPILYTPTDTIFIASPDSKENPICQILIITGNLPPEKIFSPTFQNYPKLVITDGSTSASVLRQWNSFGRYHHIPVYHTVESGSIRLPLNKPK